MGNPQRGGLSIGREEDKNPAFVIKQEPAGGGVRTRETGRAAQSP